MKSSFKFEKNAVQYKADYQGVVAINGKDVKYFYLYELVGDVWMFRGSHYFGVKVTKKQILAKIV